MKTKNLIVLPALSAGLGLLLAGRATAQTFRTLHSFDWLGDRGVGGPVGLVLSGNTLYGTASIAGYEYGMLFAINTNGTSFTTLLSFTARVPYYYTNQRLILSGHTLYGTEGGDDSFGSGTVFVVNTD